MGNRLRARLISLAVLTAACGVTAQAPPSPTPDWMSGYWLSCESGAVAENWIGAGAGVMVGTNLSLGEQSGFEFLRIAENGRGGYSYFSMPNGRLPATEFTMVTLEANRVVFENLEHDFPQRIIYERAGDALHARIEDAGATQGVDWRFHRAEPDTRCPS
jgi:hypothetical protein